MKQGDILINKKSNNRFMVWSIFPSYNLKNDTMENCYHIKQLGKQSFKYVYEIELFQKYQKEGE
jgi:hypothetical protein